MGLGQAHNVRHHWPANLNMLKEVTRTHQHANEAARRWFTSASMDLMLWLDEDNSLLAFQFSHGKPLHEQALSWSRAHGLSAQKVDDGANGQGHKGSPLLLAVAEHDTDAAITAFLSASQEIPASYATEILQHMKTGASGDIRG